MTSFVTKARDPADRSGTVGALDRAAIELCSGKTYRPMRNLAQPAEC